MSCARKLLCNLAVEEQILHGFFFDNWCLQRSSCVAQEWCSRQHSDDAARQASDLTIGAAGEGDVVFGRFSFDFEFEPQFDRW